MTASFLTHDETSRFAVFVFYTWRKRIFIHGSTLLVVETYEMGLGATGLSPNKVNLTDKRYSFVQFSKKRYVPRPPHGHLLSQKITTSSCEYYNSQGKRINPLLDLLRLEIIYCLASIANFTLEYSGITIVS